MGLKPDLNLQGDEYQWLGSLFYFGSSNNDPKYGNTLPVRLTRLGM